MKAIVKKKEERGFVREDIPVFEINLTENIKRGIDQNGWYVIIFYLDSIIISY